MNRIYQGKVTNVELANPDRHAPRILSASIPFSASDGEKVAKPDEVSGPVRCRNSFAPQLSTLVYQLPHQHHELFQVAVN